MRPSAIALPALVLLLLVGGSPPMAAQQAAGNIRGQATDASTGQPLNGVQVSIPGTGRGALTDLRGSFLIVNVPAGTVTVRAEMIGYGQVSQTVTVTAGETSAVSFAMRQTAVDLEEIVVTATGESTMRQLGTSLSTLNTNQIPSVPVKGVQDLLTGTTPGVFVLANSGQPGAGGTIRLRGNNSVSQGNAPVIYVDGVRIYSGLTPTNVYNRQGSLPLNDIPTEDIDRIEIVKGAAAATLYGTEASSGVIQIFTKRGRSGPPVWSAEVGGGFTNMGHIGSSADPTGMWLNQCRGSNLVNGAGVVFEDPTCPASGSWLRNGPVQRYSLSVRGGTDQTSYYLSGSYGDEQGVLQNMASEDVGFRANFAFRPAESLDLSLSSSYTRRNINWVPDGNSANGVLLNVSRGPNSNFKGSGCTNPDAVCVNNAEIFTTNNTTKSDHFITGLTLKYSPRKWMVNRLSVGYDYNGDVDQNLAPFGFYRLPLGEMYWTNWSQRLITMDYATTISNNLRRNLTSAFSFGAQSFDNRRVETDIHATNFSGPGDPTLTSAATRDVTGDDRLREINAGFFFQEMVGWNDRLFVTGGVRVDGNSAFGKNFGLQTYPKLSASYVISDHSFWPKRVLETFKLRGAIGESGKAPGAFDAVRTWDPIAGDNGLPGFTAAQLGNPNLGPERTREYEAGFDASALEGRLGAEFTYYYQKTMDALIPVMYPPSEGFLNRQLENIGSLRNEGIELGLDATFVRRDNVDWSAHLNVTTIRSKALNIGGEVYTVNTLARSYVKEGYPVPSYIGKKLTNPNAFADPVWTDTTYLGAPFPNRIFGLSSTVQLFKRLSIEGVGEWQLGGHLLNAVGYQNSNLGTWYPCFGVQQKTAAFNAGDTQALNDVTARQRARCAQGSGLRDYDWWVESNDFFKLRSVSVSYEVPDNILPWGHSAVLSLSGRNLWTVTDYTGTDPETTDFRDNATSRRDYYVFPQSRVFLLSLRVNF
jgi:TonB-linked SusC/RagA family outer membrane protein